MKKILITGANGFVGSALCAEAVAQGFAVRSATRSVNLRTLVSENLNVENVVVGDISTNTDWTDAVSNCDIVIHLAARVHVMNESASDPLAEFRLVNMMGTEKLALCAAANGVKRLVYVSSIKVNRESTFGGVQILEQDQPKPQEAYGVSKWEAEQALHRVSAKTGLEIVIVRPPLVYGAGVKGNFAQMLRVVAMRIPLPFAAVKNKRDLIYVGNLVDALLTCANQPRASGNTYLVSDGEAVSTPDLLRGVANALGNTPCLFAWPVGLLRVVGIIFGKVDQVERLVGSLEIDIGKIRRELGWVPPFSLNQGLAKTITKPNTRGPNSLFG